jgi:hypothetical protein
MQTVDGRLVILAGKSRSGKTAYAARDVARARRVIAWDPHDQWGKLPGWQRFTSLEDLHRAIQTRGPARLAYVAGSDADLKAEFESFCRIALQFGKIFGPCCVIAEELADVSSPGKAPGSWGGLVREALKNTITIYAISQRWAEADKTALNNSTEIVCFQMKAMDRKYMAEKAEIPIEDLAALCKTETATTITCPYIRILDSGWIERGQLKFKK